jgi:hypothetical protein
MKWERERYKMGNEGIQTPSLLATPTKTNTAYILIQMKKGSFYGVEEDEKENPRDVNF